MLLHKATYMQVVVITYNKEREREYSLELSHIICMLVYYSIV